MKIELIRRVPTTKTEYFEIIGISRCFFVLPRRSFPTIFRQLSDEWIIKSSTSGLDPTYFRVTIHYSTTAPHSLYVKLCDSTTFSFLSTCLPSSVLCFPSSVPCLPSSVLRLPSPVLCFSSSVLCSPSSVLWFYSPSMVLNFVNTVFSSSVLCSVFISVNTVFFFVSTVLTFLSTVFSFVNSVLEFLNKLWGQKPSRNSICKRLWSPGFHSEESISPG